MLIIVLKCEEGAESHGSRRVWERLAMVVLGRHFG